MSVFKIYYKIPLQKKKGCIYHFIKNENYGILKNLQNKTKTKPRNAICQRTFLSTPQSHLLRGNAEILSVPWAFTSGLSWAVLSFSIKTPLSHGSLLNLFHLSFLIKKSFQPLASGGDIPFNDFPDTLYRIVVLQYCLTVFFSRLHTHKGQQCGLVHSLVLSTFPL